MVYNRITLLYWSLHGEFRHLLNIRNLQLPQQLFQLCCVESRETIQQSNQGITAGLLGPASLL